MVSPWKNAKALYGKSYPGASLLSARAQFARVSAPARNGLILHWKEQKFAYMPAMARRMGAPGFGSCPNQYECEAACPKGIGAGDTAKLNRGCMAARAAGISPPGKSGGLPGCSLQARSDPLTVRTAP